MLRFNLVWFSFWISNRKSNQIERRGSRKNKLIRSNAVFIWFSIFRFNFFVFDSIFDFQFCLVLNTPSCCLGGRSCRPRSQYNGESETCQNIFLWVFAKYATNSLRKTHAPISKITSRLCLLAWSIILCLFLLRFSFKVLRISCLVCRLSSKAGMVAEPWM